MQLKQAITLDNHINEKIQNFQKIAAFGFGVHV